MFTRVYYFEFSSTRNSKVEDRVIHISVWLIDSANKIMFSIREVVRDDPQAEKYGEVAVDRQLSSHASPGRKGELPRVCTLACFIDDNEVEDPGSKGKSATRCKVRDAPDWGGCW